MSHLSHFKHNLASHNVITHPLVSVKSILSPLNAASQMLAHVAQVHHVAHCGIPKSKTAAY